MCGNSSCSQRSMFAMQGLQGYNLFGGGGDGLGLGLDVQQLAAAQVRPVLSLSWSYTAWPHPCCSAVGPRRVYALPTRIMSCNQAQHGIIWTTQAQASAQQLALAQQGSGALSSGIQPHGTPSMAADRAQSGALPLDAAGGGVPQQQAMPGGLGVRRTSQECGSPAPFGAASPSHSGTGNTRRGGAYQGAHRTVSTTPRPGTNL